MGFIIFTIQIAATYENLVLISVLFFKTETLDSIDKLKGARKVRLDTFEYARYGFGSAGENRCYVRRINSFEAD